MRTSACTPPTSGSAKCAAAKRGAVGCDAAVGVHDARRSRARDRRRAAARRCADRRRSAPAPCPCGPPAGCGAARGDRDARARRGSPACASSEPSSITITRRWASSSASRRSTLSPIVISSFSAATRKTHVQSSSPCGAGAPAIAFCPRTNSDVVQRHIVTITMNAAVRTICAGSGMPSNGIKTLRARPRQPAAAPGVGQVVCGSAMTFASTAAVADSTARRSRLEPNGAGAAPPAIR